MEKPIALPAPAENSLSRLQDTTLTPMEEALFQAWAKANKIAKPDAPGDVVDYRGVYKETGGKILPHGQMKQFSEKINAEHSLQQVLHQRMTERIFNKVGTEEDAAAQEEKNKRQDITHKQKMEMEGLKLKRLPHESQMKQHDVQLKKHDIQVKEMDVEKQKIGNEGKQIDLISSLVAPTGAQNPTGGQKMGTATPKASGQ